MGFVRSLMLLGAVLLFAGTSYADAPYEVPGAVTADTELAKRLFDEGVIFVDVRGPAQYAESHIHSAVNLMLGERLSEAALLRFVKKDQPVLFYCNGVHCGASAVAARQALEWGFTKVYYYRTGYPDWHSRGFPTASSR